jgi:hypothetical protein
VLNMWAGLTRQRGTTQGRKQGSEGGFQACCAPVLARARGPASSWKFPAICDPTPRSEIFGPGPWFFEGMNPNHKEREKAIADVVRSRDDIFMPS